MLKHSDLDTIADNLHELFNLIERRPDDMYITSMKQYIVNPLAWVITEKVSRAAKSAESPANGSVPANLGTTNTASDAIALRAPIRHIVQHFLESGDTVDDVAEKIIAVIAQWHA